VSRLELVDDRFGKLAEELRTARPAAPEELRERVRSLDAPPPRRFQFDFHVRRLVPAVGLAALAAAVGVAGVLGIVHGSSAPKRSVLKSQVSRTPPHRGIERRAEKSQARAQAGTSVPFSAALSDGLKPSSGRLQEYDAVLRVRVHDQDELSRRTQDALRLTRRLGGYVVWARYAAPGKSGHSELAVRIPIDHVQTAIARFSGYGSLLRQQVVLKDLQQRVDVLAARIGRLDAEIAQVERRLSGSLTAEQRTALLQRLQRDRTRVAALRKARSSATRRAQFARVGLSLVVAPKTAAAPAGRFERTVDDAGSVLLRELELLLYALVVAGPLLAIGGAGMLAGRSVRRRSDRRLLERS
jgi:hypothetical protein